jgi:hypothetical protein
MSYIVYANEIDGINLISQINTCKGFPTQDGLTITWQNGTNPVCEFNLDNGSKTQIGYGVIIGDEVYDCLTENQKQSIITFQGNINLCSWNAPIVSGTTTNI